MKFFASDLDGTLIHDNKISNEDVEAIKKFREEGNRFIVATGRAFESIKQVFSEYEGLDYDYIVACNGAIIYDSNDNIISKKTISKEVAHRIYKAFKENEKLVFACGFGEGHHLVELKENSGIRKEILENAKLIKEEEFLALEKEYETIGFICINEDVVTAEGFVELVKKEAMNEVEVFRNQFFLDIAPLSCTKGEGIKAILEIENASLENIATIGDSMNDVSMIHITNYGFTFNNAEESVKRVASHHVDSVAEAINIFK